MLIGAVVVAFVWVPGARASSFGVAASLPEPIPVGTSDDRSAGPALVSGGVLWAEPRGSQVTVMAAASASSPRGLLTLPPVRVEGVSSMVLDVVGVAGQAVVQRVVWACRPHGDACAGTERTVGKDVVRVDPATGTAAPFDACLGAPSCSGCPVSAFDAGFGLEAHDSVLVVNDPCGSGVTDLADGATLRAEGHVVAAAGSYAIVGTAPEAGARLALINWRTGERLRLLPPDATDVLPRLVGVDSDGSVAYFDREGVVEVQTITGARVTTVKLPPVDEPFDDLRIAHGAVAIRRAFRDPLQQDVSRFTIWRAGRIRRVDGQRVGGGWDFDGTRLTWAAQPCALTTIQVWDLEAPPPNAATEECTTPAIGATASLGTAGRTLRVTLTCPTAPAQGCAGSIDADLIARHGRRRLGQTYLSDYRIQAGTTATVALQLLRRVKSRLALAGRIELLPINGGTTERKHVLIGRS